MKKYRTESTSWRVKAVITPVEVERESETSVWVEGSRVQKVTQYARYHDTWEAAHAFLLSAAEMKVEYARRSLEEHKSYLGNVKGMKKPV